MAFNAGCEQNAAFRLLFSLNMKRFYASGVRNHPERVRHAPLKIALNERLDEPDLFFAEEGMRAAAPAARKPTCLRRPVIGADVEFGEAVPSEAKKRSE